MNEQIESQTILFAEIRKNNKLRTVTHSCVQLRTRSRTVCVRLRTRLRTFAVLWFQVQYAEKIKSI